MIIIYHGITTRDNIEKHLLRNGTINKINIVKDIHRVGNNCILFYNIIGSILIRTKVYNKFVQMMESSSIRENIGSRLHDL